MSVAITTVTCPTCRWTIFSCAQHDFHHCPCGEVFIDGGLEYVRFGWAKGYPRINHIKLDLTLQELYDDWNDGPATGRSLGYIPPQMYPILDKDAQVVCNRIPS